LIIHNGGKDGPVLATGDPYKDAEGDTDVHFTQKESVVSLQHQSHKFPSFHSRTTFAVDGKKYLWKGHNELVDEGTNTVIATFHPLWLDAPATTHHKIGRLDVKDSSLLDFIVVTALVVHERDDEHRRAVYQFLRRLIFIGGTGQGSKYAIGGRSIFRRIFWILNGM
jgi:hypothetical protein